VIGTIDREADDAVLVVNPSCVDMLRSTPVDSEQPAALSMVRDKASTAPRTSTTRAGEACSIIPTSWRGETCAHVHPSRRKFVRDVTRIARGKRA
jgi:hypothetical protein